MKPPIEKPSLAEAKRVLRWMRAVYIERAAKPQRGQRRRFLGPDNSSKAAD
jgi:ribosomal protein L15E